MSSLKKRRVSHLPNRDSKNAKINKDYNHHSDGLDRVLFLEKSLFIRRLNLQFLESHNEWHPTIL